MKLSFWTLLSKEYIQEQQSCTAMKVKVLINFILVETKIKGHVLREEQVWQKTEKSRELPSISHTKFQNKWMDTS